MNLSTVCPFALLTGHACPGCGMSRALWQFLQGNWAEAWAYHPLIFVMFGLLPIAFLIIRRRLEVPVLPTLWIGLGLYLGVWLLRWQTGTLPPV